MATKEQFMISSVDEKLWALHQRLETNEIRVQETLQEVKKLIAYEHKINEKHKRRMRDIWEVICNDPGLLQEKGITSLLT